MKKIYKLTMSILIDDLDNNVIMRSYDKDTIESLKKYFLSIGFDVLNEEEIDNENKDVEAQ